MKIISPSAFSTRRPRNVEGGYILLVLLLFIALLTIAAVAVAPSVAFEVRRDREEEMIHRGAQYARAVKAYYKKFNRYPSKIEDLESTNNMRFLRKRYKDPITGQDFKVVFVSQALAALGGAPMGGVAGASSPGSPGGNQFGQTANGFGGGNFGGAATGPGAPSQSGSSATASGDSPSKTGDDNSSSDALTGRTFGGGPIAGVASTSKAVSIREFNKKNHYNEWMFIYNPQMDRGGLLSTPSQPPLAGATPVIPTVGTGAPGSAFGGQGMGASPPPQQPPQQSVPEGTAPQQQ